MEDYQKNIDAFHKALAKMTKEDLEKYLPKRDPVPFGWISIEEHLPMVTIDDLLNNDALYKKVMVKNTAGVEFETTVGDHNIWYHMVKEAGVTHWLNKKD